jgi:drug/metabolite transporter (DMT)-like permease
LFGKARTWGAFWLLSLIWGASFLFIKIGLEDLQPFTLVAIRVGIGATALWAIIALTRRRLPHDLRTLLGLAFMGTFNTAIPFTLITWGEKFIDSGVAGILNATVPLFSLVIAHLALADERITRPRLAGLVLGFAGVVLIFSDDLLAGLAQAHDRGLVAAFGSVQGQIAVVAAAVCYAATAVFVRRSLRHVEPVALAGGAQAVAFALAATGAFLLEAPLSSQISGRTLFAMSWLGLLGTCLAYILYFFIIGEWGATRATLVTYVLPVFAFILGAIVLDEKLTWRLLGGALLIFGGIALVNRRTAQLGAPPLKPALETTPCEVD